MRWEGLVLPLGLGHYISSKNGRQCALVRRTQSLGSEGLDMIHTEASGGPAPYRTVEKSNRTPIWKVCGWV